MAVQHARAALQDWQLELNRNCFLRNNDFAHSVSYFFPNEPIFKQELEGFAGQVVSALEKIVAVNDQHDNTPRIEAYDAIGQRQDRVVHSPWYGLAGDVIYGSGLMQKIAEPGQLLKAMCFFFLSSHAGEAGHNCPIACSAGLIRVLKKHPELPNQQFYLDKLTALSYQDNYTGAQFLTEIQGGSDVGANAVLAEKQHDGTYKISGEKWFCSNANADLILLTARHDLAVEGSRGLGLFLLPARLADGSSNHYLIRRLKDKIGTRAMASAEIDFIGAIAYAVEPVERGFKTVMQDVLHLSRLFNTFTVLGMGRRAHQIAYCYAQHRRAFGQEIFSYPLVQQHLVRVRVENTALLAAILATTALQDHLDAAVSEEAGSVLLLRVLANLNKTVSALWSVDHIHHSIDILAGNGAIESFSSLPRLLRDSIVCENWEGTHNTLYMQILRDIGKYQIDSLFLSHLNDLILSLDDGAETIFLFQALASLERALTDLKKVDFDQQTLLIKVLSVRMHCLYASVHLLKEAHHQRLTLQSENKLLQWKYFNALHLDYTGANSNDLELMRAILS